MIDGDSPIVYAGRNDTRPLKIDDHSNPLDSSWSNSGQCTEYEAACCDIFRRSLSRARCQRHHRTPDSEGCGPGAVRGVSRLYFHARRMAPRREARGPEQLPSRCGLARQADGGDPRSRRAGARRVVAAAQRPVLAPGPGDIRRRDPRVSRRARRGRAFPGRLRGRRRPLYGNAAAGLGAADGQGPHQAGARPVSGFHSCRRRRSTGRRAASFRPPTR